MLEDLIAERRKKLEKIKQAGIDPYPASVHWTHRISQVRNDFAVLSKAGKKVALVGRVMGMRDQGNIIFLDLMDETGRFQAVLRKQILSAKGGDFSFWKPLIDIGDFVSVEGKLFKTKKGEESIDASSFKLLAKSLRPIPSEWYGLEDAEERLRKRYLDMLLDEDTKSIFRKKTVFWQTFRDFLKKENFLEVETPILELVPGGAEAEPFKTYHNALDTDFYLRISLELPLKKLLVAGFERVFEIGRIFRNEGIDKEHLQDYTQLEFYGAYYDYNDLMKLVEKLYKQVIKATCGTFITKHEGQKINWGKKWPKVDYIEVFKKENEGIDPLVATKEDLATHLKAYFSRSHDSDKLISETEGDLSKGRLIDLIFKKTVRPTLIQPCFLVDPPVDIEPLAKRSRRDPRVVERVQVMACGTELGKGFSELNDPLDQRARFEEQMRLREAGDKEAQRLDEDYLEAMEYGMPPAAGFGVSERLFAVLMDKPMRETVIFSLMRPKK